MQHQVDVNPGHSATELGNVKLVYFLYLAGLFLGITAVIGLVMAYVNKGEADQITASHYRFQIRTFWIGLGILFLGFLSSAVLVGYLILLFWLIWTIVRIAKGLSYATKGKAHPSPASYFFG